MAWSWINVALSANFFLKCNVILFGRKRGKERGREKQRKIWFFYLLIDSKYLATGRPGGVWTQEHVTQSEFLIVFDGTELFGLSISAFQTAFTWSWIESSIAETSSKHSDLGYGSHKQECNHSANTHLIGIVSWQLRDHFGYW